LLLFLSWLMFYFVSVLLLFVRLVVVVALSEAVFFVDCEP
jgi:hypothetical protein